MTDMFSKEKRSDIMSRIKGKNTKPEKIVRSLLYKMGYRFRLHVSDLPGKPDIVLSRYHKVIFINGCFWHGHKDCRKKKLPSSNAEFWQMKISANKKRDKLVQTKLKKEGWSILTIWECETHYLDTLVDKIHTFIEVKKVL